MELAGYLASITMGVVLGLIGGGGSILTVPILVYLFQLSPTTATGYSLFIVGLTALIGGISYFRKGVVDVKTGLIFAAPSFLGVYLARAFLVPSLPVQIAQIGNFTLTKDFLIMAVFAALMVFASYSMIRTKTQPKQTAHFSPLKRYLLIGLEGLLVGGITGFVGAGGGFLIIPALVLLVGLPMKTAVGTSLMIIAIKSLFGFIGDVQSNPNIDWKFLITLALLAVVGIFAGSTLSQKIEEKKLKVAFGWFVLVMGSVILFEQVRALTH